jgi:hypothetical protein
LPGRASAGDTVLTLVRVSLVHRWLRAYGNWTRQPISRLCSRNV